ncbi:MAG: aspartate aminotransferase family protein [Phycisphaeraceae bacterium]|nr:aspartate aminotransferase family protein [Phycisphaerales bacterium]MCB9842840.1 aspartate aminotransferase family protein [Phycisphaeraceae bacterium]
MSTHVDVTRSAALYERALKVLPGGVSRNAAFRDPHPLYADHAEGCRITDIEGVTRLDFANNMASLIHGHADPDMVRAVTAQLRKGTAYNIGTEIEVRYAEYLNERIPGFDMMRFVNSGTEALMVGIKASRAFTGRPMIAKAEGAYHGAYDFVEVSQTPSPANWGDADEPRRVPLVKGTPESAVNEVVVIPYNNIDRSISLLERSKDKLACLVLDLMPHRVGLNPADPEYVAALRDWTKKNGVLLLLDEVITLRSHYTGLQEQYGLRPDLTAMGKMIGGGFPIGAIAGRRDVMDVLNPRSKSYVYPHSGTFSANPISLTAGLAAMEKFDRSEVARLNGMAERAIASIREMIRQTGARASVTGGGSMFRVHMKATAPTNYREAHTTAEENKRVKVMLDHMFDAGFILINSCSCALSTPMGDAEVDDLLDAMRSGFEKIAAMP